MRNRSQGAWGDRRLEVAYQQLMILADSLTEGSPQQDCVCQAMSKLDEADMILRGIEIKGAA
jgi:hypothetical protein